MWTIIISIIIVGILSIISSIKEYDDFIEGVLRFIVSMIFAVVLGFFGALIIPSKMIEKESTYTIMNIADGSSVSGNFFIGCGTIDGKMKYTFYYAQDSNTFAMHQVDYRDAVIKYSDSTQTPHVVVYTTVDDTNYFWNKFSYDTDYGDKRYVFFVPKGSIRSNYTLDAQ